MLPIRCQQQQMAAPRIAKTPLGHRHDPLSWVADRELPNIPGIKHDKMVAGQMGDGGKNNIGELVCCYTHRPAPDAACIRRHALLRLALSPFARAQDGKHSA